MEPLETKSVGIGLEFLSIAQKPVSNHLNEVT